MQFAKCIYSQCAEKKNDNKTVLIFGDKKKTKNLLLITAIQ